MDEALELAQREPITSEPYIRDALCKASGSLEGAADIMRWPGGVKDFRAYIRRHPALEDFACERRERVRSKVREAMETAAQAGDIGAACVLDKLFWQRDMAVSHSGAGRPIDWSREVRASRECTDDELSAICRRHLDMISSGNGGDSQPVDAATEANLTPALPAGAGIIDGDRQ
jgi:hypothetical protein